MSVMSPALLDPLADVAADAAVVAGEDQHRVVGQLELVEHRHDPADALIDAGDHRGVGRVVVPADAGLVGLNFAISSFLAWCGRVDGEVRQIEEERPVLVPLDEVDRLVGQEVGQVLRPSGYSTGGLVAKSKCCAHRDDRLVEAALAGMIVAVVAEVPLAEHAGRVAGLLQRLGDRDLVQRQLLRRYRPAAAAGVCQSKRSMPPTV